MEAEPIPQRTGGQWAIAWLAESAPFVHARDGRVQCLCDDDGGMGGNVACRLVLLVSILSVSPVAAADLVKAPVFFAISIPDLEASVRWYTDNLGLTANVLPPSPRAKVAVLRGSGLLVELIQPIGSLADGAALGPRERHLRHGLTKVGFHVDDLDATVARLKQKGAHFMGSVYEDDTAGVRSIIVLDHDENLIQLFEPTAKS
jgi:catechol 2,3-dioxygenase-like lactoylglutathione lyase family enzyme